VVVDSSALIALLLEDPGYERVEAALITTDRPVMSAATLLESSMVARRNTKRAGIADLDELIADMGVDCIAVDRSLAVAARDAFTRYGKGIHPAALNFGDCFSYALARTRDEPLLFTGEDFLQTDVKVAAPPADWDPLASTAR
jgi:ribonuclease VapC